MIGQKKWEKKQRLLMQHFANDHNLVSEAKTKREGYAGCLEKMLKNPSSEHIPTFSRIESDIAHYSPLFDHFGSKDIDKFFPGLKNVIEGLHVIRCQLVETARVLYEASAKEFNDAEDKIMELVQKKAYKAAPKEREGLERICDLAAGLTKDRHYTLPPTKIDEYVRKRQKRRKVKADFQRITGEFLSSDWKKKRNKRQVDRLSREFSWYGGHIISRLEDVFLYEVAAEARILKDEISNLRKYYDENISMATTAQAYGRKVREVNSMLMMEQSDMSAIEVVLKAEDTIRNKPPLPGLSCFRYITDEVHGKFEKLKETVNKKKGPLQTRAMKDLRLIEDNLVLNPWSCAEGLQSGDMLKIYLYGRLGLPIRRVERMALDILVRYEKSSIGTEYAYQENKFSPGIDQLKRRYLKLKYDV